MGLGSQGGEIFGIPVDLYAPLLWIIVSKPKKIHFTQTDPS